MALDWLLGLLLGDAAGISLSGFILGLFQLIIMIVQLVIVSRARRYRLEAERYAMRAEEAGHWRRDYDR